MGRLSGSSAKRPVVVEVPVYMPYDWQSVIRFYATHPIPGIERIKEGSFIRIFRIGNDSGYVQVRWRRDPPKLQLRIAPARRAIVAEVVRRVKKMFDADCDPGPIAESFRRSPLLARLCAAFPGLRVARGWDAFETAVCAILGQLVSASQRTALVRQLVQGYGDSILDPLSGGRVCLFPTAEVLASSDLSAVKTTTARRLAIQEFSRRVISGEILLADNQDPDSVRRGLLRTKGLGPWSAEYISMRALDDSDAFPATDLILKRALERNPELQLQAMSPWRSYAAIYLWHAFAAKLSRRRWSGARRAR